VGWEWGERGQGVTRTLPVFCADQEQGGIRVVRRS